MKTIKAKKIEKLSEFTKEYSLILNHAGFNISENILIKDINLTLKHGETLSIIGASGSGKTTLLKLCSGLLTPTSGEVIINGINTSFTDNEKMMELMKKTGFVFQYGALINNMNIYDNLALMSRYHNMMSEEDIEKKINMQLAAFNILRKKNLRPSELSLNEKKSAAFAKILITEPDIIFLDEPFTSVDPSTVRKMTYLLRGFKKKEKTIIMSSLNLDFIYKFSDKICVLENGEQIFFGTSNDLQNVSKKRIKNILESLSKLSSETKEEKEG